MKLATDKMLAERDGGIGWMIFNNPERRNAVSLEMWEAVEEIAAGFAADPEVRVVVMRGAGDKAFVSGADISQFDKVRGSAEAAESYDRKSHAAREKLAGLDKPLIAMIHGYCLGGGVSTAMKADLRLCSEEAQFGIPAGRLGVGYGFESLKPLVDLVGPAFAKEILFTARRFSAAEALRIGLVNRVVEKAALEACVREIAGQIAENAPLTIRAAKFTINQVCKDSAERDLARAEALFRACFDSEDYAEGRRAFVEKRKPVFRGR
ncbi:MAG: enoyl-CoA hydratase/isomerase family protein [Proteobacteria bacterium]|nr:enoyl-CoA hydratase/isomerase family protein [Pseudomonadota bacterium]